MTSPDVGGIVEPTLCGGPSALASTPARQPGSSETVEMSWTFERVFYGHKGGLNLDAIHRYLYRAYYPIPETLFTGYYRAVYRVGDHDRLYERIERPFPDALEAQRPSGKFALHFSGGFDSAILAKLYDRPDADYIHFTGPESPKARALASTLKGTLHEIQITPELFIREADELCPRLTEPYAFEDTVYAYIASKKAKELGHTLVLTGDGGDWVFGGYLVGPDSQLAADVWKTLEPHRILGVETSAPLAHLVLELWSNTSVPEKDRRTDKRFARRYCQELGMPEEIVTQRKTPLVGDPGRPAERDGDSTRPGGRGPIGLPVDQGFRLRHTAPRPVVVSPVQSGQVAQGQLSGAAGRRRGRNVRTTGRSDQRGREETGARRASEEICLPVLSPLSDSDGPSRGRPDASTLSVGGQASWLWSSVAVSGGPARGQGSRQAVPV